MSCTQIIGSTFLTITILDKDSRYLGFDQNEFGVSIANEPQSLGCLF